MAYKWIYKVGLASIEDEKLLVVRKHGTGDFILPGGKPNGDEGDLQTLSRELGEELGCGIEQPLFCGVFVDVATHSSNAVVVVRLYTANLAGEPKPQAEIEEIAWVSLTQPYAQTLAPSIQNKILPFLRRRQKASKAVIIKDILPLKPDLFGTT
jgi:8-oxo-dGTP diphosphatase